MENNNNEDDDELFLKEGKQLLESSTLTRKQVAAFYTKWHYVLRSMTGLPPPDMATGPLPTLITLVGCAMAKLEAALYQSEPKLPRIAMWDNNNTGEEKKKGIKFPLCVDLDVGEGRIESFTLSMAKFREKKNTFTLNVSGNHLAFTFRLPKNMDVQGSIACSFRLEDEVLLSSKLVPKNNWKALPACGITVHAHSNKLKNGEIRLRQLDLDVPSSAMEKVAQAYENYKDSYRVPRCKVKDELRQKINTDTLLLAHASTVEDQLKDLKRKRENVRGKLDKIKRQRTKLHDSLTLFTWTLPPQ